MLPLLLISPSVSLSPFLPSFLDFALSSNYVPISTENSTLFNRSLEHLRPPLNEFENRGD